MTAVHAVPAGVPTAREPGGHRAALTLGALGVVFGDIGTSPIYTVQTIFDPGDPHPVQVSHDHVYGVISLITWSVTLIVTIKYVLLVLRADNDGEGGIMALITLVRQRASGSRRTTYLLAGLGVFGASLFFGDSMITPAISVLSAVEGIKIIAPGAGSAVLPVTVAIIVVLFLGQRAGTALVGRLFGPVMVLWFVALAALGIRGISEAPGVLRALSPTWAVSFFVHSPGTAFFSLAAVVLVITGAEALYADLGHFGRRPITQSWLLLVFPACLLNYLGQGALVLGDTGRAVGSPFFLLAPHWAQVPLVVLATLATVIASQAVITGAFSLAHQAVQLGYLPRLRVVHTSGDAAGQIYVPFINWSLLVAVLALVLTFRSSASLAFAYGTAVTATVSITTLLYFYLVRQTSQRPLWLVVSAGTFFLLVELTFFAANLTKLAHGAWLPLLIGLVVFTVLTTWQRGRLLVTARRRDDEGALQDFVDELHDRQPPVRRVEGTAVFLNRGKDTTPLALRANVRHNHVLHEQVVILSITTEPVPHVPAEQRLEVDPLGHLEDHVQHVTAHFGYMEDPNVPAVVAAASAQSREGLFDVEHASYFLSTIDLGLGDQPGMARWRKRLFIATSGLTADAAEYFGLPREQTVVVGSRIEV